MSDDRVLLGWLTLARCEGLDPGVALVCARRSGGGGAYADVTRASSSLFGLGAQAVAALRGGAPSSAARRELEHARTCGWTLVHVDEARYPENLLRLAEPPLVLSALGSPRSLRDPSVAIVGSRNPSPYGVRMARELAEGLASLGLVIVSGLARGIDTAAHEGALAANGRTVAVMATGLDAVYPKDNARLARRIAESGVLLTEFPPGARPVKHHFPRRNRIIAGLADAVVVVEAARRSGSLITAGIALGLARPVLAVPGRAGDDVAAGTLALLRDGAPLACTVADVLMELPPGRQPDFSAVVPTVANASGPSSPPLPTEGLAATLLALLPRDEEVHVDRLVELSKHRADAVMLELFNLQLTGIVDALPGGLFRRHVS